mgnify:CR=1 FL=1
MQTDPTPAAHHAYPGIALRNRPAVFRHLDAAEQWAARDAKTLFVVMGAVDEDVGRYLAVCPADAQRLVRAG